MLYILKTPAAGHRRTALNLHMLLKASLYIRNSMQSHVQFMVNIIFVLFCDGLLVTRVL